MKYFKRKEFKRARLFVLIMVLIAGMLSGCQNTSNVENALVADVNAEISVEHMFETLEVFTSEDYNGRLAGTEGNTKAEQYLVDAFSELGLVSPSGIDDYRQNYKQMTIINEKTPELQLISSDGEMITSYGYLSDFGTRASYNMSRISGETTSEMVYVDLDNYGQISELEDVILLIDNEVVEQKGPYQLADEIQRKVDGVKGIVFEYENKSGDYYTVSTSLGAVDRFDEKGPFVVYVTFDTFDQLLKGYMDGDMCRMAMEYTYEEVEVANVIGYVEGKGDETIIVSAHFDHVGNNGGDSYNPGALDNASGVSVMLEVARLVQAKGVQPEKNIVFIGFNGEEQNLFGSVHYVENPLFPLEDTVVINLDMVGSNKAMPLNVSGVLTITSDLAEELETLGLELGMEMTSDDMTASDHAPFFHSGTDAVTLIYEDWDTLHSIEDTVENAIGADNLESVTRLVVTYLEKTAY